MASSPAQVTAPRFRFLKRLGTGAFVFFLVKGLLWLLLPVLAAAFTLSQSGHAPSAPHAAPAPSARVSLR